MLIKLGGPPLDRDTAFRHPNIYTRQQTSGPNRLCIGPSDSHVELMLDLARMWTTPCWVLYVLLLSRRDEHSSGRYQSPMLLEFDDTATFMRLFKDFFEQDGRHEIWFGSEDGQMLIYDRHQFIYAYGDLDGYQRIVREHGLQPGEIAIPVPHSHNYHAEHDENERAVMDYWDWIYSPLRSDDGK